MFLLHSCFICAIAVLPTNALLCRFITEVREKLKLKVNVVRAPRDVKNELLHHQAFVPRRKLEELRCSDHCGLHAPLSNVAV